MGRSCCENSCEPMEIDLSSNSVNAMDISYSEYNSVDQNLTETQLSNSCGSPVYSRSTCDRIVLPKNLTTNFENTNKVKNVKCAIVRNSNCDKIYIVVFAMVFSFISFLSFQILNTNCKEDLDLHVLHNSLSNKVYDQEAAIEDFIKSLNYEGNNKILVLYGGTGVGKTLLVSLMLENLWNYTNIYHYTFPLFEQTFSTENMHGLILCKSSVLIIDDVNRYDDVIESKLTNLLHKMHNLEKKITLILIFNCRDDIAFNACTYLKSELEGKMKKLKAFKSFIRFEPLTEVSLKKCIENELQGRVIDENALIRIVKNFNVEQDGCKGVHQKMKYFNIL